MSVADVFSYANGYLSGLSPIVYSIAIVAVARLLTRFLLDLFGDV